MRGFWRQATLAPGRRGKLFALALASIAAASAAGAPDFPPLTGRVVDQAGILNQAARDDLTRKLEDLEAKTTDQLVVVTLNSLQGTTIENFGVELGRHWQIGQKGKNNGILLIVAPNERKVRIEVGYGLEGTMTDALSKVIIETSIVPRFRANDYPGGITRATDDIIRVLTGNAQEIKQRAPPPQRRVEHRRSGFETFLGWFFSNFGFMVAFFIIVGVLHLFHSLLVALHFAKKNPKKGFWATVDSGSSYSGGGSSWSSSDSGGGFSGGGGDFGGGGASGDW